MANPNKTVAAFRRRNPRPPHRREPDVAMAEVMDAVSKGNMTPEEGAQKMREMMEKRNV